MPQAQIYRYILIGLAVVLLACAFKNYIGFLVRDTALCPYLCSSTFRWRVFDGVPGLEQLFRAQEWLTVSSSLLVTYFVLDPWNLIGKLAAAPLVEEFIYRGPAYLTRRHSKRPAWWVAGLILVILFSLSHGRAGVALLPLLVLGTFSLWLIAKTGRIWPSVALHFLYNFFVTSAALSQAQWMSD